MYRFPNLKIDYQAAIGEHCSKILELLGRELAISSIIRDGNCTRLKALMRKFINLTLYEESQKRVYEHIFKVKHTALIN